MLVDFSEAEVFVRVSDFYRYKGVVQDKKAKFQVFFHAEGSAKPTKLNTTLVNLTQFIEKGVTADSIKLGGDAKSLRIEIIMEECDASLKNGEDSSEEEEEKSKHESNVKIVEVIKEHAPNSDLIAQNQELEHQLLTLEKEQLALKAEVKAQDVYAELRA